MINALQERTIEDILSADKTILSEILEYKSSELNLIARQKILSSGKLDLLYMYDNALILIELKSVPFYSKVIEQINGYYNDLLILQNQNKLINAPIIKTILVTSFSQADFVQCQKDNIKVVSYNPEQVLEKYYNNFKNLSYFLNIQSGDYGVVRLGLIKSTLKRLSEGKNINQISLLENKSIKTIRNRISVASLVGLVARYHGVYYLTELGEAFIKSDEDSFSDRLTEGQSNLLSEFIKNYPFYSHITYTIMSFLETVFILAKSSYPVKKDDAEKFFVKTVGKEKTWRTPKSRNTATYIYSNYACELQYLLMINNRLYLTPKGIQAILLLQLNRSIKLIESQR